MFDRVPINADLGIESRRGYWCLNVQCFTPVKSTTSVSDGFGVFVLGQVRDGLLPVSEYIVCHATKVTESGQEWRRLHMPAKRTHIFRVLSCQPRPSAGVMLWGEPAHVIFLLFANP
jgi:hypothetical protein